MKFAKPLILSILILGTFSFALATERYVRSDATGNQTGTDWANAYIQLPSSLVRGDIYYVADGSYPSYTFNDAESGTSLITVKKATPTDHGTDTGWVTAYGDGVAEFAPITFQTGYFVFEGTTGSGKSGHGFKIKGTSAGQHLVNIPFEYTQTDITIRHTEIEHRGLDTGTKDRGVFVILANDITISYCYLHDFGSVPIFSGTVDGFTLEYNVIARNSSSAASHSEGIADQDSDNVIIRYNVFEDIEGTAYITVLNRGSGPLLADNWEIYGNVFWKTPTSSRGGVGDGIVAVINNEIANNWKIYNNTIVNLTGFYSSRVAFAQSSGTNRQVFNNIWYNSLSSNHTGNVSANYNYYTNVIGTAPNSEPNIQQDNNNPFTDWENGDFTLTGATDVGLMLASPYNTDPDGLTRGLDGTWDRGAFEFVAGPPDTTFPTVSITAPSNGATLSGLATLSATASDNVGVAGVQFKVDGVNLGLEDTSAPYSIPWNTTTVANGGHTLTAVAKDGAGNMTISAAVAVTVDNVIDTTDPFVSINEPASGATVSGTVDVAASASDDVGVASVQFQLNGTNLGSADTTAPYMVSWSTATAVNGLHTLTAVATDLSGNTSTSASVTVTVSNTTSLLTGLVVHHRFQEGSGTTTADSSGNGNNGTLVNGTTWTRGKGGLALDFDGANDHVKVPDSASLNTTTNQMSLTAWVNRNASQGGWVMVVSRQMGTSFSDQYLLGFNNNTYQFCVNGCTGGPTAPTNQWVHAAATYDGTTRRLYINGVEVAADSAAGAISLDAKPLIIGAGQNDATSNVQEVFNGKVDDVRLYNRALTAEEISQLVTQPQFPLPLRTTP